MRTKARMDPLLPWGGLLGWHCVPGWSQLPQGVWKVWGKGPPEVGPWGKGPTRPGLREMRYYISYTIGTVLISTLVFMTVSNILVIYWS